MMKFQVVTIFPKMIEACFQEGLVAQAIKKGLIDLKTVNPRQFTTDLHKTVDDRPFGGGDGMTMLAEPLSQAIRSIKEEFPETHVVYLSPQGQTLTQAKVVELSERQHLTLVSGRYGGIDQRVINHYIDEEISIGDYILSGGELAAAVVIDAVGRQIPGVLGHHQSASFDSFSRTLGGLLEAPQFTRPQVFEGQSVPEVLTTGHHLKIQQFRARLSVLMTLQKRKDLLKDRPFSDKEKRDLRQFFESLSETERLCLGIRLTVDDLETFGLGESK